jgi:hypothetical protein
MGLGNEGLRFRPLRRCGWMAVRLGMGTWMDKGGDTHNMVPASQDDSFFVRPCLSVLSSSEAAKLGLYSPETCTMS